MNDALLPPDHGFPLALVIPGYVGDQWVKWLTKIWGSDGSDNYYHKNNIHVLPSSIKDGESDLAKIMFKHASTACNEQVPNLVVVKLAHKELVKVEGIDPEEGYRVQGFAYSGGGQEVKNVEVSLDKGKNWRPCVRTLPQNALRHVNKFWAWIHWYIDIKRAELCEAPSIAVRCYDSSKHTQPEHPIWNLLGLLNNCWCTLKRETLEDSQSDETIVCFLHPCEQGNGTSGWMKPSGERQLQDIQDPPPCLPREFTVQEIQEGSTEDKCYVVLNDFGRLNPSTTEEFDIFHAENRDDVRSWASEYIVGVLDDNVKKYRDEQAKKNDRPHDDKFATRQHRWTEVAFHKKEPLSQDSLFHRYTFKLLSDKPLGLDACHNLQLGYHFQDALAVRYYTPTRPIFEDK
ncbi:hypothetical protein EYZ11_004455 [Aspergillus tanneri]|uniref:Nitrate reductase [NADPH] n=1 Tax=Aspergillus tanneri TaxID=1220188 RepID=A0A4S3JKV0_9EURO|nr:hypothetical protein EYZ11_004455 [Aspergillus tanneri]